MANIEINHHPKKPCTQLIVNGMDLTNEVFRHAYTFEDGHLHPGEAPGIGVELDEELAAAHPYEPGYLPVNRLQDGSVHDW